MKSKIILFSLFIYITIYSQINKEAFSNFGISLNVSNLGVGLEASTHISNHFSIRAGFSTLEYTKNSIKHIHGGVINVFAVSGNTSIYNVKRKLNFNNFRLLFNYYPSSDGIFFIAAGAYMGTNKGSSDGYLTDIETGENTLFLEGSKPYIIFGKYILEVDPDSRLKFDLISGHIVKPYLGIGIGRSIPEKRLGFLIEAGVMYAGELRVKQHGKDVRTTNEKDYESISHSKEIITLFTWTPILNLQLTYRLFQ